MEFTLLVYYFEIWHLQAVKIASVKEFSSCTGITVMILGLPNYISPALLSKSNSELEAKY